MIHLPSTPLNSIQFHFKPLHPPTLDPLHGHFLWQAFYALFNDLREDMENSSTTSECHLDYLTNYTAT
jgi:hypothetical protein